MQTTGLSLIYTFRITENPNVKIIIYTQFLAM